MRREGNEAERRWRRRMREGLRRRGRKEGRERDREREGEMMRVVTARLCRPGPVLFPGQLLLRAVKRRPGCRYFSSDPARPSSR